MKLRSLGAGRFVFVDEVLCRITQLGIYQFILLNFGDYHLLKLLRAVIKYIFFREKY